MIHYLSCLVKPSTPSFLYPSLVHWLLSEKRYRWYHLVNLFLIIYFSCRFLYLPFFNVRLLVTPLLTSKVYFSLRRAWTIISNIWSLIDKILTIYIRQISFSKAVSVGYAVWHRMHIAYIEYLCHKWPWICSTCKHFPNRSSCMIYYWVCK